MAIEKSTQLAEKTFATLCGVFDKKRWRYERQGNKLSIRSGFGSKDFPVEFVIRVSKKNEIVSLISQLPFKVNEKKKADMAMAIVVANNKVVDGNFNYNMDDGSISFRLTSNYKDSTLGEGVFEFMVACAIQSVDAYNDKFFMLSKDMMTLEQFIQQEKESGR